MAALIVVEMVAIAGFVAQSYVQTYITGRIVYGCSTLQASTAYEDSSARWIVLTCPNGPAVSVSMTMSYVHEGVHTIMYPTFSPPRGLLGLFVLSHDDVQILQRDCRPGPDPYGPFYPGVQSSLLVSGVSAQYNGGGPLWDSLDYCAVVKSSAQVDPFNIRWTVGHTPLYEPPGVGLSVSNATVASAPNQATLYATVRVVLTSIRGLDATLTLASGYPPTFYVVPAKMSLKAGGTNSTLLTIEIYGGEAPGLYAFRLIAYPLYGLRFYGDYSETPSYSQNFTIIHIRIT